MSIIWRMLGTAKPTWFTVVPRVPPVGAWFVRKKISTFGNLMISVLFVPIVIAVPPSVSTKNFFCAARFAVFRW